MCGIAGIVGAEPTPSGSAIRRMTDALAHRGPDAESWVALTPGDFAGQRLLEPEKAPAAPIWLGHRRLSIIDVSGTPQPLSNEDGSVWTVFNGEIYNYQELADDLRARGHDLRHHGDTEVLVHLWEEYGEAMLERLVGMFAFAICDLRKNRLFLARDRYGQKPLVYWRTASQIAFASELQALWQLPDFPFDDLRASAMARYFQYGYVPNPQTVFANVDVLPPGHYLIAGDGEPVVKAYWQPRVTGEENEPDDDALQRLLDQAVKRRLRADVPLGAFLSGGIDSSLIAASMMAQSERAVETFTIATKGHDCDESEEAAAIAQHLGTTHRCLDVTPDFITVSETLARHYGQPFADYSSVPTYYVSRATRQHVTVALSGDGGDELFAGYERYQNGSLGARVSQIPGPIRQVLAGCIRQLPMGQTFNGHLADFILSAAAIHQKGDSRTAMFHEHWRQRCFESEFQDTLAQATASDQGVFESLWQAAASEHPLNRWLEADQRSYLCDDILTKVDIASMAVSLECRAPMLDHHFAEFANRITIEQKIRAGRTKHVLRELAARRLPREILDLPKKGFTLPLGQWLRAELRDWGTALLFDDSSPWQAYLQRPAVEAMWAEHQKATADHSMRLWMIMALCLWHRSVAGARSAVRSAGA